METKGSQTTAACRHDSSTIGGILQPSNGIYSAGIESINPVGKYEWIESERKSHQWMWQARKLKRRPAKARKRRASKQGKDMIENASSTSTKSSSLSYIQRTCDTHNEGQYRVANNGTADHINHDGKHHFKSLFNEVSRHSQQPREHLMTHVRNNLRLSWRVLKS